MVSPTSSPPAGRRPPALRRCWLCLPGADQSALSAAMACGADVLIQELEDFTPPEQRPGARALAADLFAQWRAAGIVAAVRINPLHTEGRADLEAVMRGRPDIVLMSKVAEVDEVVALDGEVTRLEQALAIPTGSTELVPNVESARGIRHAYAIAKASPRITGVMGSTEDLAADLGAPRSKTGSELAYARQRLHFECTAANVLSIDCPYTFADLAGAASDARYARQLGYVAKSAVDPQHVAAINRVMTPSTDEIAEAHAVIAAFEAARAAGKERGRQGDLLVEVPTYFSAKRLIARAAALGVAGA
ncbi:MAG TPA: CoA ester lyase [Hyphomicrobiaceae bacterium]|nr:CoA ester lyase [Hyphomicrobiaceae bacterium]